MIKVVVLGTAGSAPTKTRHLPCVALVHEGDILLSTAARAPSSRCSSTG